MMKDSKSVLLFEFKYHQEIIPSQILFLLEDGFDVHVFLDENLWDEALFSCFAGKVKITRVRNTWKWYNKITQYFKIKKYVRDNSITHLVVNTLDSTFGSFIIRALPRLHKVGIAHRVHDISTHKTFEANVRQMDAVLTLSIKTNEYLTKHFPWVKSPSWFYPIFFCSEGINHSPRLASRHITVAIPGQISNERRDYYSLINAAKFLKQHSISVKFKILGDALKFDGPKLMAEIESSSLQEYFTTWNGFVPYSTFFSEMSAADYVMPLLSPDQLNSDNYHCSQISAAINWALAFRKKLLLHDHFKDLDFVSANALLYNSESMTEVLSNLSVNENGFVTIEALTFENVKRSYLTAFESK